MRESLRRAKENLQERDLSEKELSAQNEILKRKTEQLLMQNEDYSKMISKLSRYYFHIKQANQKIDDLKKILQMFDDDLEHQLTVPNLQEEQSVLLGEPKDLTLVSERSQKFF